METTRKQEPISGIVRANIEITLEKILSDLRGDETYWEYGYYDKDWKQDLIVVYEPETLEYAVADTDGTTIMFNALPLEQRIKIVQNILEYEGKAD